jgi:hypothetical protein
MHLVVPRVVAVLRVASLAVLTIFEEFNLPLPATHQAPIYTRARINSTRINSTRISSSMRCGLHGAV